MLFTVDDDARLWELEPLGDGAYKGRKAGDREWQPFAVDNPRGICKRAEYAYFDKCIVLSKRVKELTAIIEKQEGARRVINIPNTD